MDFLLYLSPSGNEIYQTISKKIKFVENTPICRKYDIYGWFDSKSKTMTFCTNRIKFNGNASHYINETLYHESTHVAQSCKNNKLIPLGLYPINLPPNKESDLKKSTSISGLNSYKIEREAFWLEDKPKKVLYYLKKFCF